MGDSFSITTCMGSLNPADILKETDKQMLEAFAIHPKADPELLSILAAHDSSSVKLAVVGNSNTPSEILDHFSGISYYASAIARNPNASAKTLARILANEKRGEAAYNNALSNRNLPLEVILQTLLEYMPTSSAIALKSNERFSELMSAAKKIDENSSQCIVDETMFDVDADSSWE